MVFWVVHFHNFTFVLSSRMFVHSDKINRKRTTENSYKWYGISMILFLMCMAIRSKLMCCLEKTAHFDEQPKSLKSYSKCKTWLCIHNGPHNGNAGWTKCKNEHTHSVWLACSPAGPFHFHWNGFVVQLQSFEMAALIVHYATINPSDIRYIESDCDRHWIE